MSVYLRARARKLRNRWMNPQLRQLEVARQQLLRDEVDVLVLSDSSVSSFAPRDTDRTLIPELISRQLGGARVATVAGPGFGGSLHAELVRILSTIPQRPKAVVFSSAIRTNTMQHVLDHPIYSYPATRAALARTHSARHRIRALGRGELQTPEQYAAFEALPVTTRWSGETTIGEFRAQVKGVGPQPWPAELEALLFDYFHGELYPDDHPGLAALTRLGALLRDYGVPAAMYWCPPPRQRGELHYPGEFAAHVDRNLAQHEAALLAEAGDLTVVDPGLVEEEDFEDPQNATEHFSYSGRLKIATAIAEALPMARRTSVGAPTR